MEQLIGPMWNFISSQLGLKETLLLLLAALALYGWHQFLRARHLAEANEHERRRSQAAFEDLERLKRASSETRPTDDRRQPTTAAARSALSISRVLVVEDDQIMQTIIPVMLSRCLSAVDVRIQETTQKAKDEIERFKPDLLVLDLHLKKEHGLDLLEDMRTMNARLPVLVYSGYEDEIERLRAARELDGLENVTILQKGSDLDVFMRIVPTLFRRRSADRTPGPAPQGTAGMTSSAGTQQTAPKRERRSIGDRRVLRPLSPLSTVGFDRRKPVRNPSPSAPAKRVG
jgi:CheY-like chemotaxis protein